ncbi:MAG: hypothetical protein L0Y58_16720 [Verrucomicrobia subdivision 3 bacterium]|nr:hypothetical protein [Limisphaerales bacterium]
MKILNNEVAALMIDKALDALKSNTSTPTYGDACRMLEVGLRASGSDPDPDESPSLYSDSREIVIRVYGEKTRRSKRTESQPVKETKGALT